MSDKIETYTVEWQVVVFHTLDNSDTRVNQPSFEVKAKSLEKAKKAAIDKAKRRMNKIAKKEYKKYAALLDSVIQSVDFIPRIITLTDKKGNRYEIPKD